MITDDRFKNMTPLQYIFHYLEICKYQRKDMELEIKKLKAGSSDIKKALKYLMIVVSQERGKKAVEIIEEEERESFEKEYGENKDNNGSNANNNNETGKALKKEDQELWDFMMSTPETMALPEQARKTRDYVVEAKSLSDVAEDLGLVKVEEDINNVNDDVNDDINSNTVEDSVVNNNEKKQPMIIKSINNIDEDPELELGFDTY